MCVSDCVSARVCVRSRGVFGYDVGVEQTTVVVVVGGKERECVSVCRENCLWRNEKMMKKSTIKERENLNAGERKGGLRVEEVGGLQLTSEEQIEQRDNVRETEARSRPEFDTEKERRLLHRHKQMRT